MTTPEEIKGLERRRTLLVEKLNRLREARLLETDESVRFKYEHQIAEAEQELADVNKQRSEACGLNSESGQSILREKVKELTITEEMGPLHLVNCNRQTLRDRFEEVFDYRQNTLKAPNHYYFLSSCPKQMPPSLGERMVHELLGELLDGGKEAIFCRFNTKEYNRVVFKKLPISGSLKNSQESFRKFMAGHFDWPENTHWEQALAQNLFPKPAYAFSILPFKLNKRDWKGFFPEYFDWIASELARRPSGGPTLMLFFVFYLDDLHLHFDPAAKPPCTDARSAAILKAVDDLLPRHPAAGHFYPLMPVDETDLRDWFFDLGENNDARLQPVLDTLVNGLPAEENELYQRQKSLNMDRVELVQKLVYEEYLKG